MFLSRLQTERGNFVNKLTAGRENDCHIYTMTGEVLNNDSHGHLFSLSLAGVEAGGCS